jgi:hypothetical protein
MDDSSTDETITFMMMYEMMMLMIMILYLVAATRETMEVNELKTHTNNGMEIADIRRRQAMQNHEKRKKGAPSGVGSRCLWPLIASVSPVDPMRHALAANGSAGVSDFDK